MQLRRLVTNLADYKTALDPLGALAASVNAAGAGAGRVQSGGCKTKTFDGSFSPSPNSGIRTAVHHAIGGVGGREQ